MFELIQLFLLATFKYVFSVPYVLLTEIEFKYALPTMVIGGMAGFLFFYFLSKKAAETYRRWSPPVWRFLFGKIKFKYGIRFVSWIRPRRKPVFSLRNRMIVRVKKSYGMWGIVIATPILLSIPVGAFLASRYYSKDKKVIGYMLLSITGWGLLFSSIWLLFPGLVA